MEKFMDFRRLRRPLPQALGLLALWLASACAQANITAMPSVLTFNLPVGGSAPAQQLTIQNNSGAPVSFTGIQISPSGLFNPGTLGTCFLAPVPNGGACSVSISAVPQPAAGSAVASFAMTTLQFGSLPVAQATLNLNVGSGGGVALLSSVSPLQIGLSSGRTARLLAYTFANAGAVSPRAGYLCTQLVAGAPPSGATSFPPCAPGAQSGALPLESAGLQVQHGGGQARALETVSFPESVFRLAVAQARSSGGAPLYFIREFDGPSYAVVQLVAVGASMADPLTLTDVRMGFETGGARRPTLSIAPGQALPPVTAEILYSGSGTLRGRWEVVEPGRPVPTPDDLVPEASVPFASRGLQRRYTLVERFEHVLGPGGRFELRGPDPARLPVRQPGAYFLLLRIEAVPARQPGLPAGAEHGAAGFALPVLMYQVGTGVDAASALADRRIRLLSVAGGGAPALAWAAPDPQVRAYRVELANAQGVIVGAKFLRGAQTSYRLGGMLARQVRDKAARWRVLAFDAALRPVGRSDWQDLP
jgi:hypothetical protein